MENTPIDPKVVEKRIKETGMEKIGAATIREIVRVVNLIEEDTGEKYIRMEMGVPGLDPAYLGTMAEIEALRKGVASKYPNIEGVSELKQETSRFVKNFLDIEVSPRGCVPTTGSMQGSFAAFITVNRNDRNKEGTLFIDPGFPVQKMQCRVLGHDFESFDVYDYRGEKLRDKLEEILKQGKMSSILYSNPNNPAWFCFNEQELEIIGEMANKYGVVVIEDLAYFGMDFRKDISVPGQPPFQPTVAKYTDHYILLISCSKVFSFAGQRVGLMVISDKMYETRYPDLRRYYSSDMLGHSIVYGALYALSAGTSHSAQYGVAAILKAANDGQFNIVEDVKEYGRRARIMKKLFRQYGFNIVYDKDVDVPIADGFYFTISYPGFSGVDLLEELLYYGISAISLDITGSTRSEGLRACVSQTSRDQIPVLESRLKAFHKDHPV